ncbi:MAG: peroxidase-related enzyme [Thermomicrobiales bacterium]
MTDQASPTPSHRQVTFTQRVLDWQPWLETVDEIEATPEQLAVVDAITTTRQGRAYWATLAHDPESLRARMALYGDILSGEGAGRGPRADRELAATATSRVTSCVYCASVHSRAYSALVEERDTVQRLLDDGPAAHLPPRERAVVDYAVKLALHPETIAPSDLQPLRDLGLTDLELLDITNAAAIFANANRLMATLGEARAPDR